MNEYLASAERQQEENFVFIRHFENVPRPVLPRASFWSSLRLHVTFLVLKQQVWTIVTLMTSLCLCFCLCLSRSVNQLRYLNIVMNLHSQLSSIFLSLRSKRFFCVVRERRTTGQIFRKSHSSVFLCFQTPRKRLIRRLRLHSSFVSLPCTRKHVNSKCNIWKIMFQHTRRTNLRVSVFSVFSKY